MTNLVVFACALQVGWQDFRQFWTWKSWLAGWMLRIATTAIIWVLLGRFMGSYEQMLFLLIGNVALAGPTAVGWTIAASTLDRWDGTYSFLVAAPSGLFPAIAGRTAIWFFNGVATSLATFMILCMTFNVRFPPIHMLYILIYVILFCFSTYCFTLVIGAFVTRAPKLRNIAINVTNTSLMAFCGISVPSVFWPEWIQVIAFGLPLTHGVAALRLLLSNGSSTDIILDTGLELIVAFSWLGASMLIIDRMAEASRTNSFY
jgi:ABC-2 type transport system permease protein